MSLLARLAGSVEAHNRYVEQQIRKARGDKKFARSLMRAWNLIHKSVENTTTPTGLELPALALPQTDEPAEVARYLFGEGPPGQFPFVNAAYPRMYQREVEEPTRLFAGLGLAE